MALTSRQGRRLAGRCMLLGAALMHIPLVHGSCRLDQISEFHVERVGNVPVVDGQVNGQPIRILLETGAVISFITDTAAHRLDLPVRDYSGRMVVGVVGTERVRSTVIKELKIGRFVFKDYPVLVSGLPFP